MAINKVKYGNQTLIDLSTDTVSSAEHILLGKVGHLRDGTVVTGTASGGDQHGTIWQDGQGNVHLDDESGIALQSKTATPSESQQVIEADEGYYALDKVTVGAISSSYVGSGVARRSSSDLTASGATVTVPAGYYASQASKAVASGTAGTPTATKGTVSNHAVTVTPSVTNTTGYITGGTKTGTAVTVSASELVSGTYSITNNGQYNIAQYASVNVNVGNAPVVSENDPVRFFDYDGTLLYSYSASAFQALTAMPANPSHSGLTAQGWNWTLADAKAQLTAMGACDIGQMYVTDDGKTRLYCHFEEGRLAPYLGLCPNGTVTIDWGDNTATSTLTGTSLTSAQRAQHTYASAGDYVITLTATSGTFGFLGTANGSYVLQTTETNSQYISNVYTNSIRKIELGTGAVLGNYSFALCYSLKSITIPNSVTSFGTYIFYYCYSLENIVVPNTTTTINTGFLQYCYSITNVEIPATITTLGSSYVFGHCYSLATVILPVGISSISQTAFNTCYSLSHIVIPNTVTSFGNSSFASCRALANITIPNSVTTISTSAFSSCYCLGEIHFKGTTPPTVQNSNAFSSVPTDCKIYVPRGYLSAYTSATNYPSSATYTYVEE